MAIEFAIMAPLVIILVFAVVQFGLWLNAWQGVHAAAREGARVASLSTSDLGEVTSAISGALVGVSVEGVDPSDGAAVCTTTGATVSVSVEGTRSIAIPFYGTASLPVSATGRFRCE